jgi:hypothetical protein
MFVPNIRIVALLPYLNGCGGISESATLRAQDMRPGITTHLSAACTSTAPHLDSVWPLTVFDFDISVDACHLVLTPTVTIIVPPKFAGNPEWEAELQQLICDVLINRSEGKASTCLIELVYGDNGTFRPFQSSVPVTKAA